MNCKTIGLLGFSLISLPLVGYGQTPTATIPAPTASILRQAKKIDSICKNIDRAIDGKKLAHRIYVDVGGAYREHWKRFKNQKEVDRLCNGDDMTEETGCYSSCYLYYQDGKPVLAAFSFSSPSGDWVTYADYYFRPDGTVMKDHCDLRRFGALAIDASGRPLGDADGFLVRVIRDLYYDNLGKCLLAPPAKYFDMDKKKEVPKPAYMDGEWPRYLKLSDLPFHDLGTEPKP